MSKNKSAEDFLNFINKVLDREISEWKKMEKPDDIFTSSDRPTLGEEMNRAMREAVNSYYQMFLKSKE